MDTPLSNWPIDGTCSGKLTGAVKKDPFEGVELGVGALLFDGLPLLLPLLPMLVNILLADTSRELFALGGIEGGFNGLDNDCSSVECVGGLKVARGSNKLLINAYLLH